MVFLKIVMKISEESYMGVITENKTVMKGICINLLFEKCST